MAEPINLDHFREKYRPVETEANLGTINPEAKSNTEMQTDPVTPRELDAKLATVRVEMDGRLSRIEDKLSSIDSHLTSTRNAVWGAAAVTIGAVLAALGLVVTSFDSGRETSMMVHDATKQLDEALAGVKGQQAATQDLLERLSRRFEEANVPPAVSSQQGTPSSPPRQ